MNVLLVNMPFAAIRPAIGVSLLKAHLEAMGLSARVLYLNLTFAQIVGSADYHYVAEIAPSQGLAGDWIFSRTAFGPREAADAAYLETFLARFPKFSATPSGVATLERCRAATEGFLEDCLNQAHWEECDLVGFTSTFTQHVASLALARRLKQRFPHLRIAFGGGNCEAEMGLQLHRSFPFVDFVCSGEADRSFPRLLEALINGREVRLIPGVISRYQGESRYLSLAPERIENLDSLPYPEYSDFFEQHATAFPNEKRPAAVLMETSRGCWWGQKHHCTFCGLNGTSMTFRSKSAARVLDEIAELCRRYQACFIEVVDNILDMRYFHDLIPELKKRRLRLGLFYETKANLTKEQIRALHDAGVVCIQPGIESFSTDALRIMRKGTTAVQNVQLLKWCKEIGLKVFWNLIYGFPGEDPAEYQRTAAIMQSIHHLEPAVGFGAIRLDRFSPNFFAAKELGISNVRPDRNYRYIYDVAERDLFDLAYYFEHDYADGRDPESYVGEAYEAFRKWQRTADSRGLVYAEHGENLAIWDLRARAAKTLTILAGYQKAVYLYCDQNRSLNDIKAFLAKSNSGDAPIEGFLEEMTLSKLMIYLDRRYLSLAIRDPKAGEPLKHDTEKVRAQKHLVF